MIPLVLNTAALRVAATSPGRFLESFFSRKGKFGSLNCLENCSQYKLLHYNTWVFALEILTADNYGLASGIKIYCSTHVLLYTNSIFALSSANIKILHLNLFKQFCLMISSPKAGQLESASSLPKLHIFEMLEDST